MFAVPARFARLVVAAPRFCRAASTAREPLVLLKHDAERKVATLTLNEPARLNALTVEMGKDLAAALERIDYKVTNAVVITGAGRAFSAGGDLAFLENRSKDSGMRNSVIMHAFYNSFLGQLRRLPVPTVAAINGPAVGAGLCFALGADLRVAAKNARLSVSFVQLGLHPGMGSTFTLQKLIGPQQAARMLLTGEPVTGEEAARMGLVLEATEEADVVPRALALAETIAKQAPVAVRSAVRSLRMNVDVGLDFALQREADAQSYSYSTRDLAEGVAALQQKRKPAFGGGESYEP